MGLRLDAWTYTPQEGRRPRISCIKDELGSCFFGGHPRAIPMSLPLDLHPDRFHTPPVGESDSPRVYTGGHDQGRERDVLYGPKRKGRVAPPSLRRDRQGISFIYPVFSMKLKGSIKKRFRGEPSMTINVSDSNDGDGYNFFANRTISAMRFPSRLLRSVTVPTLTVFSSGCSIR